MTEFAFQIGPAAHDLARLVARGPSQLFVVPHQNRKSLPIVDRRPRNGRWTSFSGQAAAFRRAFAQPLPFGTRRFAGQAQDSSDLFWAASMPGSGVDGVTHGDRGRALSCF